MLFFLNMKKKILQDEQSSYITFSNKKLISMLDKIFNNRERSYMRPEHEEKIK